MGLLGGFDVVRSVYWENSLVSAKTGCQDNEK